MHDAAVRVVAENAGGDVVRARPLPVRADLGARVPRPGAPPLVAMVPADVLAEVWSGAVCLGETWLPAMTNLGPSVAEDSFWKESACCCRVSPGAVFVKFAP